MQARIENKGQAKILQFFFFRKTMAWANITAQYGLPPQQK